MINIPVPGFKNLCIDHLVLDYNGTIAFDGKLIEGVASRLTALSRELQIHVLTADTFGTVTEALSGIPCNIFVIPFENQAAAKQEYIRALGIEHCAAIGNGRNDRLMLREAALGIAVILGEGASCNAIFSGDVTSLSILDALDLLLNPLRLIATLRS